MSNIKARIDFTGERPLDNAERLKKIAKGLLENPEFSDCGKTSAQTHAIAQAVFDTHENEVGGTKLQHDEFVAANLLCQQTLHDFGVYANFKCHGIATQYAKLGVETYDASNKGKSSSVFSLENGPASGELIITVPKNRVDESTLVMYSFDAEAVLGDYKLAGANNHCSFSLTGLPIGVKIYVIYATIGGQGIGEFSVPYPIIVT